MLLAMTAQQLGTHKIDMEKLISSFQSVDADRREMLAAFEVGSFWDQQGRQTLSVRMAPFHLGFTFVS